MLAFSNDYYGFIFRATQSVEVFCAYKKAIHIMSRSPINEKKKINNFLEYGTIDDFDEERCICGLL